MPITNYPRDRVYDYVSTVDPTANVNPVRPNALWLNATTGQLWTCTNNARNVNVWVNQSAFGIRDSDPYWDKVELLISPTGVNGSNVFEDLSTASKKTIIAGGNVNQQWDNRIGRSVIYFDGADDRLSVSNSRLALGTGSFTIEFWVHPHNGGTAYSRMVQLGSTAVAGNMNICRDNLVWPYRFFVETYTTVYNRMVTQVATLKPYTWNHIAVQREGGANYTLWVNGVLDASATNITGNNLTGTDLYIGADNANAYDYTGCLSDVRITKGVARYSETFNPELIFYGCY